jgi:hypothetical protein
VNAPRDATSTVRTLRSSLINCHVNWYIITDVSEISALHTSEKWKQEAPKNTLITTQIDTASRQNLKYRCKRRFGLLLIIVMLKLVPAVGKQKTREVEYAGVGTTASIFTVML